MKKYFIVALLFSLLLITGCGKKEEKSNVKENNVVEEQTKKEIKLELKNNKLYVNDNMVDFYSINPYKDTYPSEDAFYSNDNNLCNGDPAWYKYEKAEDFVLAKISPCAQIRSFYYLINSNGKIVETLGGANSNLTLSVQKPFGIGINRAEKNSIYVNLVMNELPKEYVCDNIKNGNGNDIAMYVDKITYIGNDTFKVENDQKVTYRVYASSNKFECN